MTHANLIDYENKKLKYARKWCYVFTFLNVLQSIQTFLRRDVQYSAWMQVVQCLQTLNIIWFMFLSEKKNIKAIYVAMVLIQFRAIQAFFEVGNVFQYENPREMVAMSLAGVGVMVWNQLLIHVLFTKWRNRLNIALSPVILLGICNKVFDTKEIQKHVVFVIYLCVIGFAGSCFFIYIFSALLNLQYE